MKQSDKDFLLISRCHNDEQRIKMLEFFRFLENSGIPYESFSVKVQDLRIKPETVEQLGLDAMKDLAIDFDIYLTGRKITFNLFSSTRFSSLPNKTEAVIRYSVQRALRGYYSQKGVLPDVETYNAVAEAIVVAVRQHFIALNINTPTVFDMRMESPWFRGDDIEIWLLRGSNFDKLCSALLV